MTEQRPHFVDIELPLRLIADLRRLNPWWAGQPMPAQPKMRRHVVAQIRRRMDAELAPIVAVRGPRQVGKTTAQSQIIEALLAEGVPPTNILWVQFDILPSLQEVEEPILAIADWFEHHIAAEPLNALARAGQKAHLFFDEVQNLDAWDAQLKFLVDTTAVKVLITGSSALRIERGRDSLAGRISTVEVGVLSLTEIGTLCALDAPQPFLPDNGLRFLSDREFWRQLRAYGQENAEFRNAAFRHFSERGGYPIVHTQRDIEWAFLAAQLNETVIRRVIQHDLQLGRRGRGHDAQLLEEIFRLACRYAGQAPSAVLFAEETRLSLGSATGTQQVTHYLRVLADSLLLRLIPPLELRLKGKRGSPKLCLADHGLRASWLQEQVPLTPAALAAQPEFTTLAGHLAGSIFGSVASAIHGLDIAHFPARGLEQEVDFVFTVGLQRVPVEIKYQRRIDPLRDTLGIRSFLEKAANNAAFGLLIVQDDSATVEDPRIVSMPLSTFMLLR